ncbi:MAG: hypothetical protein LLF28_08465 [Nitrospiraceae bacterium]|nr:hypothetical protein [Nitrospiraceae bacterium]
MKRKTTTVKFFSKEELKKIEDAVAKAEMRTIGEIAVMVVDSSDNYLDAEVIAAAALSSVSSLIVTAVLLESSIWFYIPLNLIFFFPLKFICRKFPFLKAPFIGSKRKNHAVRERALRAFYEKGLYKTKMNTGVLFFLSLFERKVWVLADRGINEKIKQEKLNSLANIISVGIIENHASDALCDAIKKVGNMFEKHFPTVSSDTNELSNDVITE